jgi:hypothetical protein
MPALSSSLSGGERNSVARATDKTRIMLYSKCDYKRTINLKMRCNKKQKSGGLKRKSKTVVNKRVTRHPQMAMSRMRTKYRLVTF